MKYCLIAANCWLRVLPADLPPREILIGQVARALQAPVAGLTGLLNAMLANPAGRLLNDSVNTFAGLLEGRAKQLEEGA